MNDLEAGNHISNKSYVVNMEGGNATGANNSNAISRVRLGGIPLPGTELKTYVHTGLMCVFLLFSMGLCNTLFILTLFIVQSDS